MAKTTTDGSPQFSCFLLGQGQQHEETEGGRRRQKRRSLGWHILQPLDLLAKKPWEFPSQSMSKPWGDGHPNHFGKVRICEIIWSVIKSPEASRDAFSRGDWKLEWKLWESIFFFKKSEVLVPVFWIHKTTDWLLSLRDVLTVDSFRQGKGR